METGVKGKIFFLLMIFCMNFVSAEATNDEKFMTFATCVACIPMVIIIGRLSWMLVNSFRDLGTSSLTVDEDEDEEPSFNNNRFKKLKTTSFNENKYKQFCGVEIECLNTQGSKGKFSLLEQKKYQFGQGTDGSLSSGGLEFRSSPTQGDRLIKNVNNFCNELIARKYKVDSSCGLHIHIETPRELELLQKLYIFYSKFENQFLKLASKSRQDNKYCERIYNGNNLEKFRDCKTLAEFLKLYYETNYYKGEIKSHHDSEDKRYCWCNMHSIMYRSTLEIRLHAGTINPKKIINWFLIHLTVRNKLENMSVSQVYNLKATDETFLKLFNKNLQEYIKLRWDKLQSLGESELTINKGGKYVPDTTNNK
jgi:hypothetical protein